MAGATENALVALAGPLPGLLLALAVLWFGEPRWVGQGINRLLGDVTWMLVAINGFNLLPILPFDGGRVFQELLFARAPWLDVLFRLVAIGGVAWLAWFDMKVLGVIAAFMVLALPQRARVAFAVARLRRERHVPADPDQLSEEQLQAIFAAAVRTVPMRLAPKSYMQVLASAVRDVFDGAARTQASLVATLGLVLFLSVPETLAPPVPETLALAPGRSAVVREHLLTWSRHFGEATTGATDVRSHETTRDPGPAEGRAESRRDRTSCCSVGAHEQARQQGG